MLPLAYGSMCRNGGRFFTKISESKLLFLPACTGEEATLDDGVSGRSIGDLEDAMLDRVLVLAELGDIDLLRKRERSTIDGLPAYTTDTTRAVSSWLVRLVGDVGSSLLESYP